MSVLSRLKPGQENPIVDREIEKRMIALMVELMQANDAPLEQYERLGLPVGGEAKDKHLLLEAQYEMVLKSQEPPVPIDTIPGGTGRINLETPLKAILAEEQGAVIIEKYFPMMSAGPMLKMAGGFSLKQIAGFAPAMMTPELLKMVADELAERFPGEEIIAGSADKALFGSEAKIEQLVQELTLEEKVSLLAGASMWYTTPVERLGIPSIKVTDGPNGARGGGSFVGGITLACFPVGISLASTWNPELVEEVGQVIGQEAKTKGARMLLAPTVNIHRHPLNGRNFECYSKDPYLSSRIAVGYINGVQSEGVGATVKHFVCNDSEFERNSTSSEVDERTLQEIYLPPFKAAVKEAKIWGVMSAYNKLNGTFCSENPDILIDILKKHWGFDGIVMSDWFGAKSTAASVNGGQDLEMPGPPQWRGKKLLQADNDGDLDLAALDESVRRMLRIIERSGAFAEPKDKPEEAIDNPKHRAIARQAAAEGIVLLKNESILPLDLDKTRTIALIGPNVKDAKAMGGRVPSPGQNRGKRRGSGVRPCRRRRQWGRPIDLVAICGQRTTMSSPPPPHPQCQVPRRAPSPVQASR